MKAKAFLLFFSALLIFSCKKETSQTLTPAEEEQANVASTESDAEAEGFFNGTFDDAMGVNTDVGIGGTGIFGGASPNTNPQTSRVDTGNGCLTVTLEHTVAGSVFPIRITMDFGTVGCAGPDGHWRKGKIITVYSNRLIVPGATAVTEFSNFSFDSITVANTSRHKITNTSGTTNRQFKVEVNAKLTKPNGNYNEWVSNKVITQSEGLLTNTPLDDFFKVTGSATGRVKRNDLIVEWHSEITEPLIKRFNCRWISKGRVRVVRQSLASNTPWVGILDYGAGLCDNQATLTINGNTHQITLH